MRDFSSLSNTHYDLVIIGGGINGAGVARDAALRGLKTLLLEKGDFASGTTSWSTRLVHGGLRYLEYFEFSLVRESLREREILLNTAPHLVEALKLTIPIYTHSDRPYWKIWAGMILYDVFSYDKTLPWHQMLPQRNFQQLFRSLDDRDLKGGAQYYDAQVAQAERLCLENLWDAQAAGATILNYACVTELVREGDRLQGLTVRDELTGETFHLELGDRAVVINTSGPWVDQVCGLGTEHHQAAPIGDRQKMGGTKGSHIIVETFPGAPETALYTEARRDQRPIFVVPWLGMYLIGTTDLPYSGDLDHIKASDDEVDYLLAETNALIPSAQLTRQDVKFTYSGVRPLPNEAGKKPGSITRRHILVDHAAEGVSNLISLVGGKLTTYRSVGEEMVDAVYQKRGETAPPCPTQQRPLPGAILPKDPLIGQTIQRYRDRVSLASIDYLFSVYGRQAEDVLALVDEAPDLAQPIAEDLPDIRAQIVYSVRSEMAQTLVDILRRRTLLAVKGNYGRDLLPVITDVLAAHCGWSREACDRQQADYHAYIEANCLPDYGISREPARETSLSI